MYQVLYRKWRPRNFEDVIGQEHVTQTLKNEVVSGHIAHAYLFTGSRGTGKTSCAKIFSLAVNCKNPINGSPCGECEICKEAAKDALLDVSEIDAASNNGVENIRSIKEESFLVPTLCKYRVYIIDEAHMLSTQAFNAFLKVLEEPPKHIIFILATTEPHKIPTTILSRCQRFEFRRIKSEEMSLKIKYICEKENFKISDEAIEIIINSADGAMRDALSLLDRCVSCCGNVLDDEKVREILGITDKESVKLIYQYIKEKNTKKSLELIDDLYKTSKSMMGLCEGLLDIFREEMVKVISDKKIETELREILENLTLLSNVYKKMSEGCDSRLELEIAVIKLCLGNSFETYKINENSENVGLNGFLEIPKHSEPETLPPVDNDKSLKEIKEIKDNKDTEIVKDAENKTKEFSKWESVIEYIKKNSKSKSFYLAIKDSQAYEDGDFVLIASNKNLLFDLLGESTNKELVRNAIQAVSGRRYRLGPYKRNKENKENPEKIKKNEDNKVDMFAQKAKSLGINVELE